MEKIEESDYSLKGKMDIVCGLLNRKTMGRFDPRGLSDFTISGGSGSSQVSSGGSSGIDRGRGQFLQKRTPFPTEDWGLGRCVGTVLQGGVREVRGIS